MASTLHVHPMSLHSGGIMLVPSHGKGPRRSGQKSHTPLSHRRLPDETQVFDMQPPAHPLGPLPKLLQHLRVRPSWVQQPLNKRLRMDPMQVHSRRSQRTPIRMSANRPPKANNPIPRPCARPLPFPFHLWWIVEGECTRLLLRGGAWVRRWVGGLAPNSGTGMSGHGKHCTMLPPQ